jgi:hypothetical protein
MGFNRKQLKEASKPLYGFDIGRIKPISSDSLRNACTEYITFDVVDMNYPYNSIFGRGLLNTFEATLHSLYPYLKVPAAMGVISVRVSQKDAKNIEQGFAPATGT